MNWSTSRKFRVASTVCIRISKIRSRWSICFWCWCWFRRRLALSKFLCACFHFFFSSCSDYLRVPPRRKRAFKQDIRFSVHNIQKFALGDDVMLTLAWYLHNQMCFLCYSGIVALVHSQNWTAFPTAFLAIGKCTYYCKIVAFRDWLPFIQTLVLSSTPLLNKNGRCFINRLPQKWFFSSWEANYKRFWFVHAGRECQASIY